MIGVTAGHQTDAIGDVVKSLLSIAIKVALTAEFVVINSLVFKPIATTTSSSTTTMRRRSSGRRLQAGTPQRQLATGELSVKFTAAFADVDASSAALVQVARSPSTVAFSIQTNVRAGSSSVLSGATVRDFEAKESRTVEGEAPSRCSSLSGTARELCEKAKVDMGVVIGGAIAACVLLVITFKLWYKSKCVPAKRDGEAALQHQQPAKRDGEAALQHQQLELQLAGNVGKSHVQEI